MPLREEETRRRPLVAKPVDRRLCENYLRKPEEMLDVAQHAIGASPRNLKIGERFEGNLFSRWTRGL